MKFFRCSGAEGIVIDTIEEDKEITLSFWAYGNSNSGFGLVSIWDRITIVWRYMKYIIKHGNPYTDEIVLDLNTAKDLVKE